MSRRRSFAPNVWVIHIAWDKDHDTGPIGPVIGDTRCNQIMTLMRKRLRANNESFKRVYREPMRTVDSAFGWSALRDPVDDLLSSVSFDTNYYLETGDAINHD